ncbi:MAG: Trk system potassium transporter TrkA [Deltaproteobacteria bacterium]|nr:Trk system potassium transporter TrkA [Deltaproteobacteria bacterium]
MKAIVIGAGVVGYTIAQKLSSEGQDVVLIEQAQDRIDDVKENLDVRIIKGSGSSPQTLIEAGIEKAELVIAVTNSDEVNMIACLIAETQSRVPKKIARIRNPDYINYSVIFEKDYLDLDLNINPEKAAADRILKIIEVPGARDVVDFVDGNLKLVGCKLGQNSKLVGKKTKELKGIFPEENIVIVAIYRGTETIIPSGPTTLKADDLVFAITASKRATELPRLFGVGGSKSHKTIIIGGGEIGGYLAEKMESKKGHHVKVIERDNERCKYLAEILDKTIVISGDGTDQELLNEENVSEADTFIAVTDDEEANILTSLLAKRLGAERCISLIDKPEYLSMVSTVGIDVAVSPRLASVSDIMQFVRRGNILSVKTLMEDRVEAIETIAMETSDIVGVPLSDIKFPKGAIIGAITSGEDSEKMVLPSGDTVIEPGDKVIIFALRKTIKKVEQMLMVKPEFF